MGVARQGRGSARQSQGVERKAAALHSIDGQGDGRLTRLARGLERAYKLSGAPTMADFCAAADISYHWFRSHLARESEPMWLRYLRHVKRVTGLTWDEILGR